MARHRSFLRRLRLPALVAMAAGLTFTAVGQGAPDRALACGGNVVLGATNTCAGSTGLTGSFDGNLLNATNLSTGASAVAINGTANSAQAAIRGTNGGSGAGVRGGANNGIGVNGTSTTGTGVVGIHSATTGTAPGVRGDTGSTTANSFGVFGRVTATSAGSGSAAVRAQNLSTNGNGFGLLASHAGSGAGVRGTSVGGTGVVGSHDGTTGTAPGAEGDTSSSDDNANAVLGTVVPTSPGGLSSAVRGVNNGTGDAGIGMWGSQAGSGWGVYGTAPGGVGVYGLTTSGVGVEGDSTTGRGVLGLSSTSTRSGGGDQPGVYGSGNAEDGVQGVSSTGNGVYGTSSSGGADVAGVYGKSDGAESNGVIGIANNGSQPFGVWGQSGAGYGVVGSGGVNGGNFSGGTDGVNAGTSGLNFSAVYAHHDGADSGYGVFAATAVGVGVEGLHTGTGNYGQLGNASDGVHGLSTVTDGNGVVGEVTGANVPYGIWGIAPATGWAGFFQGDVNVTGSLSVQGTKNFKIDDPQDPTGHYLVHAAVESPAPTDVYSGNVTTDANGDATVSLPAYFQSINANFRYQLTVIGTFAQAIVARKIADNRFAIKTDKPNVEVSWQVTADRNDPYLQRHPFHDRVGKPAAEQGTYLDPALYGQPASKAVNADHVQALDAERAAAEQAQKATAGRQQKVAATLAAKRAALKAPPRTRAVHVPTQR